MLALLSHAVHHQGAQAPTMGPVGRCKLWTLFTIVFAIQPSMAEASTSMQRVAAAFEAGMARALGSEVLEGLVATANPCRRPGV